MNSGNRGVVQLTWKFLACASVIVALLVTGHVQAQKPAVSIPSPTTGKSQRPQPLKLKTLYDVKERIAQAGGGADVVVCDLTFEFTNTLPIPIRIAFPPVGVFFGGQVSFAKADNPDTPTFARTNEIVELKPNESRTYVSKEHTIVGLPGECEWVFGLPSQGSLPENLFVGSVYSVPKQR